MVDTVLSEIILGHMIDTGFGMSLIPCLMFLDPNIIFVIHGIDYF